MSEYDHSEIEKKWQAYWEHNKTFEVGSPGSKKLFCMDMFPYPSGDGLHIGHPLGYSATDIFCRFKRMQGYSVLHPMGFDAFGLPTEQHAVKVGEHPSVIAERNCEVFRKQLKNLGYSYDWSREVKTCDPDYYKWSQWIFLQLYDSWYDKEQGKARPISELEIPSEVVTQGEQAVSQYKDKYRLAYLSEELVNWCPELGSVLANEEVINGLSERGGHPVFKKPMKQWMLKITEYGDRLLKDLDLLDWPENIKEQQRNWIGKRYGVEIDFKLEGKSQSIKAFTTRVDTLFGVTFFVLSPEHPLVSEITTDEFRSRVEKYCDEALHLSELDRTVENRTKTGVETGGFVVNPINEERIPIYVGDYVLMNYGTGAVMGVPCHDPRDFEFARTFNLPIRPVVAPPLEKNNSEFRMAVIDGEVAYPEPGLMLPCDSPVAKELALEGKSNEDAKELITAWLEGSGRGRRVVNYKLRDWLFSRQRYWGEPIPIVHWDDGSVSALPQSELPLLLPPLDDFKPSQDGESPLAKATDWLYVTHPESGIKGRRETNTMPNWAGSCWYYLRYLDPDNKEQGWDKAKEAEWMPVDLYVGGAEHAVLHLLYARFWHKVLYDLGYVSTKEPFQKLINQGMILAHAYRDSRGSLIPVDLVQELPNGEAKHKQSGEVLERISAKMSKSLRNVVNPDEIVKSFGADTLRLHMMFMGPLQGTRMWDSQAISGTHRFLKKAWRFVTGDDDKGHREVSADQEKDTDILKALHKTTKKVTEGMESFQFNTPIAAMMEFLNFAANKPVAKSTMEAFVLLLAPFAPHISEELWERLGNQDTLSFESWPSYDPKMLKEDRVKVVIQVNGKKRSIIEVDAQIAQEDLQDVIIKQMADSSYKVSNDDRFITVYQSGSSIPKLVNVLTQ